MNTIRKKILLSISSVLIVIVVSIIIYYKNPSRLVTKTIEFKGCVIDYKFSNNDYYDENLKTSGHGGSNEYNYYNAKINLIKCLCKKYLKTKDIEIKSYIEEYYNTKQEFYNSNYNSNVILRNIHFDSIIKYQTQIFDTLIGKELIVEYSKNKNDSIKKELLSLYRDHYYINYHEIVKNKYWFKKLGNPSFDSICKYSNLVFNDYILNE